MTTTTAKMTPPTQLSKPEPLIPQLGFNTYFCGLFRGARTEEKRNRDGSKTWIENYIFVEGRDFNTYKFKLTKEFMESGLYAQLEKFNGKNVTFECFSTQRVWDNRIMTDHYYKGSKLPTLTEANHV